MTVVPERPETPPKPSFIVPFCRETDFVERKIILDRIHQACSKPASRAALVGLGGVGKSQPAIEYAYRVRDRFKQENGEVWVFWVHAGTRARVEEGFQTIAHAAEVPGRNQPGADIFQLWLMILDSANDINVFYGTDEKGGQVASAAGQEKRALWTYVPQSPNGSILITTRNKDLAHKLTEFQDDGLKLVEALDYRFQRSEEEKSSLLNRNAGDLRRDGSASNSVVTTWQISFDHIRSERPFFDPQGIPEYLVRPLDQKERYSHERNTENESITSHGGLDDEFEEDIAKPIDFCLVSTNKSGDILEMHALVQLATQRWLDMHKETKNFMKQYIHRMAQAFPPTHFENWETCRQLFPHVERAICCCPADDESLVEWARLLRNAGWYSEGQGNMAQLASTYQDQGRWKEAEALQVRVVEISKAVLGPDHPSTLTSISNLAFAWSSQCRDHDALELMERCLEAHIRVLGPEHPDTQFSLLITQD
ncbi:hypothetical protein F5Y10DRAFT_287057 [Nemania abortiva]|nr:hypothetical protein F5Y10DRAFT_287057 [Nemania abortiva]